MSRAFDENELLERVDNDLGFLADTVQMLESDGRALMQELKVALAAADPAAAGRTAHTLKGMISNFCAPDVQALALDAERAAKAGDCAAALIASDRLEPALEALIGDLANFVKERS